VPMASAAVVSTQGVSSFDIGYKITTSALNSILQISKSIFIDGSVSGFGETTDPTILDSNGNCPVGYVHVDYNNDTNEDAGECWRGLALKKWEYRHRNH